MEINHKRITDGERLRMFLMLLSHQTVNPFMVKEGITDDPRPTLILWVSSHTMGLAFALANAISFTSVCHHPQYGEDEKGRVVISIS